MVEPVALSRKIARGPVAPAQAGCCGYGHGPRGQAARHCTATPRWAGTRAFQDGSLWCCFACTEHRSLLDESQPLESQARFVDELHRRRGGGVGLPVRAARRASPRA